MTSTMVLGTGIVALILTFGGIAVWAIEGTLSLLSTGMIWTGMLIILLILYTRFGDVKKLIGKKSSRYAANMVVMIAIFSGIVIFMSMLGQRHKTRFDFTQNGRFTLSSQTVKVVKSLKKPVKAIAFYRNESGTIHGKQRQKAMDLLEEYASLNPNFSFTFIDPDRNPGLANKYGVSEYRIILLMSEGKQVKIGNEREEMITNKLIKLLKQEQKVIYFVKGHGEKSLTSTTKNGYRAARESIMGESYVVREIALLQAPAIPSDASVVILNSPVRDLTPAELDKIDKYYKQGGALLVQIDPGHPPGLTTWLEGFGFKLQNDVIIDQQSQVYGQNYLTPVVYGYDEKHPLTKGFTLATYFPIANSVYIDEDPKKGSYQLAMTGPNAWTEVDREQLEAGKAEYNEEREKRGPVPVMAVTTYAVKTGSKQEKKFGKIILVGDSDYANNTNINLAGNGDLFLNTIGWLADEAELIAVRAKKRTVSPVVLTASQGRAIFWIPVVMIPSAILMVGVGIYSRRRWARGEA